VQCEKKKPGGKGKCGGMGNDKSTQSGAGKKTREDHRGRRQSQVGTEARHDGGGRTETFEKNACRWKAAAARLSLSGGRRKEMRGAR